MGKGKSELEKGYHVATHPRHHFLRVPPTRWEVQLSWGPCSARGGSEVLYMCSVFQLTPAVGWRRMQNYIYCKSYMFCIGNLP